MPRVKRITNTMPGCHLCYFPLLFIVMYFSFITEAHTMKQCMLILKDSLFFLLVADALKDSPKDSFTFSISNSQRWCEIESFLWEYIEYNGALHL